MAKLAREAILVSSECLSDCFWIAALVDFIRMNLTAETRSILEELERRKDAKEDPCDSCDGTGASSNSTEAQSLACAYCLGQGVLLTVREYFVLMGIAITPQNEDILDSDMIA